MLPWYGSKTLWADQISKIIGPHDCYWELFSGSAAVLFAKERVKQETICDLHADLIELAKAIQDDTLSVKLFDKLTRTAYSEDLFLEARAKLPFVTDRLDRAYYYFVQSWMAISNSCGTTGAPQFSMRYDKEGGDSGTRFARAVSRIPFWWERLRGVTILNVDCMYILSRIPDDPGTVIYCDPPYLVKGKRYEHDFKGKHSLLRIALDRFRAARVLVSYYSHPEIEELYAGWQRIELKGVRSKQEVLFVQ